jgi:hypothetical protein
MLQEINVSAVPVANATPDSLEPAGTNVTTAMSSNAYIVPISAAAGRCCRI